MNSFVNSIIIQNKSLNLIASLTKEKMPWQIGCKTNCSISAIMDQFLMVHWAWNNLVSELPQ